MQVSSLLQRGAPLTVAAAYQELVGMGFYGADEAGVPAPGARDDFDAIISLGTSAERIAFEVSSPANTDCHHMFI